MTAKVPARNLKKSKGKISANLGMDSFSSIDFEIVFQNLFKHLKLLKFEDKAAAILRYVYHLRTWRNCCKYAIC
jgi:hypothetical protein